MRTSSNYMLSGTILSKPPPHYTTRSFVRYSVGPPRERVFSWNEAMSVDARP